MHLSNANLFLVGLTFVGLREIPLDQRPALPGVGILNEVSLIHFFGQFKLAAHAFFRCVQYFSFTESLILAQDERWRRA